MSLFLLLLWDVVKLGGCGAQRRDSTRRSTKHVIHCQFLERVKVCKNLPLVQLPKLKMVQSTAYHSVSLELNSASH
jgi:hypothetical protein